jgi:DivIVA domain-containing protein
VAEAGFSTARRGYSPDEVRAFLTSVSAELRRLQERERQIEAELRAARAAMPGRAELDDDTVAKLLGEETLRVLQTARESAAQIKVRAEESAARALREAHDEANRLRQDAEVDAARRRQDAQSEAEAEVAVAKQQGREMVNEARAYRERVLADLERRTKLARQHIEELAHGRERLLQVFERARLVAVDVTSELQAIAEPDEYVNLSPTTGPVPLMVPGSPRPPSPRDGQMREPDVPRDEPGDATAALSVDLGGARPFDAATDDDVIDGDTIADETIADTFAAETIADETTVEPEPEPDRPIDRGRAARRRRAAGGGPRDERRGAVPALAGTECRRTPSRRRSLRPAAQRDDRAHRRGRHPRGRGGTGGPGRDHA